MGGGLVRRCLAWLVLLGLGLAGQLPEGKPYSNPVSLNVGLGGLPLEAALRQLARAVGLTPLLSEVPNLTLRDPIPRLPFRQAWDLLIGMQPGSLDYLLLPNGVLRVASPQTLKAYLPPAPVSPPVAPPAPPVLNWTTYPTAVDPQTLGRSLEQFFPRLVGRYQLLPGKLLLQGDANEARAVLELLQRLEADPVPASNTDPVPTLVQTYPLGRLGEEAITALREFVPGINPLYFAAGQALVVRATASQHQQIMQALVQLRALLPPPAPPVPPPASDPPAPPTERLFPIRHARAENLQKALSSLLEGNEAPRLQADPRTNHLLAVGSAAALERVARLLEGLDQPVPQIALRIRVESIDNRQLGQLGIEWKATLNGLNLSLKAGELGLAWGTDPFSEIGLTLNALQSRGVSHSELHIDQVIQQGELGEFRQGGSVVVIPTSQDEGAGTSLPGFQYGISVSVRPQLSGQQILLEFETRLGQEPVAGPANTFNIAESSLKTRIALKSGQTVVLGGLVNQRQQQQSRGLPWLSEIPWLGELFRSQNQETAQTSLLYIITASTLDPGAP